jgi:hypothetical protein
VDAALDLLVQPLQQVGRFRCLWGAGMQLTALPRRLRQGLDDRLPDPGMIVRGHELDADSALAQPEQEVAPARATLAMGARPPEFCGGDRVTT